MLRHVLLLSASLLVCSPLHAQDIQRGKVKKVEPDKGVVVLTVDGKDVTVTVEDRTRIFGREDQPIEKALAGIKVGADVMFKALDKDGMLVLIGLKEGAPPAAKGDRGIQRGKVQSLDVAKMRLTLLVEEKEKEFALSNKTHVLDAPGKTPPENFALIKKGAEVFFKVEKRDGADVIVALKLAEGTPAGRDLPKIDTSALVPINDLGAGEYKGSKGGFYPDGKNERPANHEAAGLALAKQVQPLDAAGEPSPDGKIVLLSVGMSNTAQASQGFQKALAREAGINPRFLFVNGAQGGMTAFAIQDPEDKRSGTRYWTTVDDRLRSAGVSRHQVQAVWIKEADAGPKEGFPGYAKKLEEELTRIVQLLPGRFPNVKLVYLTSRTYGGYARTPLNPDPYAYESGFSVKWLIERQIAGEAALNFNPKRGALKAPWLSWGPYFWANGAKKRSDGFFYEPRDFAPDGTHLSASGQEKVGRLMVDFFRADTTTRGWFLTSK
ncbi:MAG: hypothetical protein U0793_22535 [Gemmataceae bacterium]